MTVDNNGVLEEAKKQCLSENLAESIIHMAKSIDRMATEVPEDRQELCATLKKLV